MLKWAEDKISLGTLGLDGSATQMRFYVNIVKTLKKYAIFKAICNGRIFDNLAF